MYSGVVNYTKQRIEISDEQLEEGLKYCVFKKYAKANTYSESVNIADSLVSSIRDLL